MKRIVLSLLSLAILAGCSGGDSDKETFTFTFNPPDSITYTVGVVGERGMKTNDTVVVDSNLGFSHFIMTANDQGGYTVVSHTDSTKLISRGQVVNDPIQKLFTDATITRQLDSTGFTTSVSGYQEVFRVLDSAFAPDVVQAIRQRLDPVALEQKEAEEWNTTFANQVGKSYVLGEYTYDVEALGMVGGIDLSYFTATVLSDTSLIGGQLCGHISTFGDTDPAALAKKINVPEESILKQFDLDENTATQLANSPIGSSMFAESVMELQTMLLHSDNGGRELRQTLLDSLGNPQTRIIFETQNRQYLY